MLVASIVDCLDSTEDGFPDITHRNVDYMASLYASILHISNVTHAEPALSLKLLHSSKYDGESHLVRLDLSSSMERASRAAYIVSLSDSKHLGWPISVSEDLASPWLNVSPKSSAFSFESRLFARILYAYYVSATI